VLAPTEDFDAKRLLKLASLCVEQFRIIGCRVTGVESDLEPVVLQFVETRCQRRLGWIVALVKFTRVCRHHVEEVAGQIVARCD
jgi:hypothetical protein